MFNIQNNLLLRNIVYGFPEEQDFNNNAQASAEQVQNSSEQLKVLRTYADGSVAFKQREVKDLLGGLDSSVFMPKKDLSPNSNVVVDTNIITEANRFQPVGEVLKQETLLAKISALGAAVTEAGTSPNSYEESTNFTKAMSLNRYTRGTKMNADLKKEAALALKPILESFQSRYANDVEALAKDIPEAKRASLDQKKMGEFKHLDRIEITYMERSQRLQIIETELSELEKVINAAG